MYQCELVMNVLLSLWAVLTYNKDTMVAVLPSAPKAGCLLRPGRATFTCRLQVSSEQTLL